MRRELYAHVVPTDTEVDQHTLRRCAALHLTATLPSQRTGAAMAFPYIEYDVGPNPLLDLAGRPVVNSDGTVSVPTGPGQVPELSITNFRTQKSGDTSVVLEWDAATGARPSDFVVQSRPTDSDQEWTDVADVVAVTGMTARVCVSNLNPATRYNFRVRAQLKAAAWSSIPPCMTAERIRTPKWSDIVTDTDKPPEIDVTRVQMLFFTVISAFFVGLKIVDAGMIPEIDPTYVMLMGISNGVYVTAKFVRN